jgi:hypothetical protein
MSTHENIGGDVEDAPAYERRYTNDPVEKIESQSFDDEKGDPYVRELGNPDIEEVDIASDGDEKEIGTGERGGNYFITLNLQTRADYSCLPDRHFRLS